MRAKLERAPRTPRRAVELRPNLRAEPGFDFTFSFTEAACGLVNADGLYVVQVEADPDHTLAETNETDNFGYSLIRVSGLEVELLERGRGRSPWDASKVVVEGVGE